MQNNFVQKSMIMSVSPAVLLGYVRRMGYLCIIGHKHVL